MVIFRRIIRFHKKSAAVSSRGFTLIEMLMVVAIIILITAATLANNAKFGGAVLLQNLAYDIALSVREAQVYGISVHRFNNSFTAPFGMHFDTTGGNQYVYVLFADAGASGPGNGLYDSDELVQSTNITRGYYIAQLCTSPTNGAEVCGHTTLDVTYQHPEPDAYIRADGDTAAPLYQSARIVVAAPRGDTMNICLGRNGDISVHGGTTCY